MPALSKGLFWELNPGPLAPEARIMPLDQTASGLPLRMIDLHRVLSCACALPPFSPAPDSGFLPDA